MSLKLRIVILVTIFIAGLMLALSAISTFVLVRGFEHVEERWANDNLVRVKEGFNAIVENMSVKSADWGIWSDTYNYAADPVNNQDYATSNLNNVTFSNLQIDHFLIINDKNEFVYQHSFDFENQLDLVTPQALLEYFKDGSSLLEHPDLTASKSGILVIDNLPALFTSRAILTSEKTGPSHGTLAFVRKMDKSFIDKLSSTVKFDIELILPNNPIFKQEIVKLSKLTPFHLSVVDEHTLVGFVLFLDFNDNPAFIFKIPMKREIAQEAINTRTLILGGLLCSGFIFSLVFILFLNKLFFNRISNITEDVKMISQKNKIRLRVSENDELGLISKTVNVMLDKLDASAQEALAQQEAARLKEREFALEQAKRLKEVQESNALIVKRTNELERMQMANLNIMEDFQQARKDAEAASRAKSQFLANMSHEIRTPLNAIIGFSNLLKKTPLNTEQQVHLDAVITSGQLLVSVINDILDISKIEAGKVQLEVIDFDLQHQLKQAVTITKDKLLDKPVEMKLDIDPDLPKFVKGDPTRLQQVVVNLLSNAAKFTESGSITLSAKRRPDIDVISKNKVGIWVGVIDTGIGIPADKINLLFKSFNQADSSTTRKFGGTGLGLAICKNLIELMGGRIWIESTVGQGSSFQFELPIEKGSSPIEEQSVAEQVDVKGTRVLVVEDSKPNQDLMKAYCKMMGVTADFANNGQEAIDQLLKDKNYAVVLMDMQMPVMGGIEATEHIRRDIDAHLPIIALTAAALKEDQDRCLASGMNDFLTKPIDINKLRTAIGRFAMTKQVQPSKDESNDIQKSILAAGADLGLPEEDYKEILKEALQLSLTDVDKLYQAIEKSDYTTIKSIAHRLKGTFGNLRCEALAVIMKEADSQAARNEDLKQIRLTVDRFAVALKQLSIV